MCTNLCRRTELLLVLGLAVGWMLVLLPSSVNADYLHSEEELRNYTNAAVVSEWLAPGHFASRDEIASRMDVYSVFGANQNFAWYSEETTISVDGYLDTEWALRTPVVVGGHNYSTYDRGFWFTKLKYIFKPGENIQLHVFYYNGTFINRVCGNHTRTLIPPPDPNRPPIPVARDRRVEQDRRAGAPVLLDGSGSYDPDGDPLTYTWTEGGATIAGPTASAQSTVVLPLGRHYVTLTVRDGSDATASANAVMTVVDTTPPILTVPANTEVEQATRAGTAVPFAASASDICDAAPQVVCVPASGTVFPLGLTTVNVTATDASGNRTQKSFSVQVVDTTPPVLKVPEDITVEQATSGGTTVSFEVTAKDICDASPDAIADPPSGTEFPLGTTKVTCTATDDSGNQSTQDFDVTVRDTTRPDLNISVSQSTLWPPDHDLINVGLSVQVSDICDHAPDLTISVTQDEPVEDQTGDGNFAPDAKLVPAANGGWGTLWLRGERKGNGDGRVYLIVIKATDDSGNVSEAYATVTVAKSQSKADKAAVAAQAAAALAAGSPLAYDAFAGPVTGPKQ